MRRRRASLRSILLRDLSVGSFAQWLPRTRSFTTVPLPYENVTAQRSHIRFSYAEGVLHIQKWCFMRRRRASLRSILLRDLSVESFAQWLPRTRSFTAVPLPYENVTAQRHTFIFHTPKACFISRRGASCAAGALHCGAYCSAYSPSIISFRVARFLSKSKSSTAMPRTFAFSHVPSTGMCAGSISHSRIIGSSFTA